jgi:tetratricopeptide (TPR) repeat protein
MELTTHDLTLLEAYSDQKLAPDEVLALKAKFIADSDFRNEAKIFLQTIATLKKGRKQNIQSYLKGIEQNLSPIMVARPQQSWSKITAIAASLILVVSLVWYFGANPTADSETTALLSEFVQPYSAIGILKDDSAPTPRVLAMTAYANGNYRATIEAFAKVPKVEQTPLDIFYLAYANLETKNYDAAKKGFESILNNNEVPITATQYYLALCNIAQQNKTEAIHILSKIRDEDSGFGIKTKALLGRLK